MGRKPGVIGVFVTTGVNNLVLRVSVRNAQSLHRFLTSAEFRKLGVEVAGSQIITETVKDERPLQFMDEIHMKLSCDLCKGEITSRTPYTIRVSLRRDTISAVRRAKRPTSKSTATESGQSTRLINVCKCEPLTSKFF